MQLKRKAESRALAQIAAARGDNMTTVQVNLPDELAQKAASAGMLSGQAMEAILREQLRRRAGEALQEMWRRGPKEELTPEIEQEIVEEVRKVRAEDPEASARAACGDVTGET